MGTAGGRAPGTWDDRAVGTLALGKTGLNPQVGSAEDEAMRTAALVIIALALLPLAIRTVITGTLVAAWITSAYGKVLLRVGASLVAIATICALAVLYQEHRAAERYQRRAAEERAFLKAKFPNGPEMVRLRAPDGTDMYVSPGERIDYVVRGYEDPLSDDE